MSYTLNSPCGICKKSDDCTDGKIIAGARDIIHSIACGKNSSHKGSGTITHECTNLVKINAELGGQ